MSAITVNEDVIHYEVLGRGRPVVLLHGWLGSWRYWVPTMQQLQAKYRVYALDFFGFGDSGKNPERYSLDRQVELFSDFIREMGIPKAAIIGHGLGAVVAAEYAHRSPEIVARLMLISLPLFDPGGLDRRTPVVPAPPVPTTALADGSRPSIKPLSGALAQNAALNAVLMEAARIRAGAEPSKPAPAPAAEAVAEPAGHNPLPALMPDLDTLLSKAFKRSEPEYAKLRVDLERTDARALPRSINGFDSGHMLDTLRLLAAPSVVLHGVDDPILPSPNEAVWNYVTTGKDATLLPVPLPGIRHFPMLEYDRFARFASDFLDAPDINRLEIKERWRRRTR